VQACEDLYADQLGNKLLILLVPAAADQLQARSQDGRR
jgi:hypothetical protein